MSSEKFHDLTGFWTGVYDYPDGIDEAVPFNVIITDMAGTLTGEIVEGNTFSPEAGEHLYASLVGGMTGQNVFFTKTYEDVKEAGHKVVYEGTANAELTKIEGKWIAPGNMPHESWSGPFIMNRSAAGAQSRGRTAKIEEKQKT